MVIFHSYVSLPEGIKYHKRVHTFWYNYSILHLILVLLSFIGIIYTYYTYHQEGFNKDRQNENKPGGPKALLNVACSWY